MMLCTPKLQFVAQLQIPPKGLRMIEMGAIRAIIGGPGLWAVLNYFFNFRTHFRFLVRVMASDTLCRATRTKTNLCTGTGWTINLEVLEKAAVQDEAAVVHPFLE